MVSMCSIILIYCYNPRSTPILLDSLNKDLIIFSKLLENEKMAVPNAEGSSHKLNTSYKKYSVTGQTFIPKSSSFNSKSYFVKLKKSTSKKIKNLILVPNKIKTQKNKNKK